MAGGISPDTTAVACFFMPLSMLVRPRADESSSTDGLLLTVTKIFVEFFIFSTICWRAFWPSFICYLPIFVFLWDFAITLP